MIEQFEDKIDLEVLNDKIRKNAGKHTSDIPMHIFKKIVEICEDENVLHLTHMEKLDKNSAKKLMKRICEIDE